jgi:hypothetical protein
MATEDTTEAITAVLGPLEGSNLVTILALRAILAIAAAEKAVDNRRV